MAEAKTEGNQWKVDLHFHTIFSSDGLITLEQAIKICRRKRIDCIAVTDHNEINGALRLKKAAPFKVIIGEEIKTNEGGLNRRHVPRYLLILRDLLGTITTGELSTTKPTISKKSLRYHRYLSPMRWSAKF